MTFFHNTLPEHDRELRQGLYEGDVFLLPDNAASRRVADDARDVLHDVFGSDPRSIHERISDEAFFDGVGAMRRTLFYEQRFRDGVKALLESVGVDPERVVFDPLRMRAVKNGGHHNPKAKAVYYAHRDTWYGHPQGMVTWWIPLDDLLEEETFVFYPERFSREVPNNSEIFDYADWVKEGPELRIGWQKRDAGTRHEYPGVTQDFDPGPEHGFACTYAQNLIFSGSQFHRTRKQEVGRTRFSLDFRWVHLDDHNTGLAAPNTDNRSRGSAISDYVPAA